MEICRDIATRFNGIYGEVFKIPEPYIPKVGARIMSLTSPENKMSKSDKDQNGCVYMLEKPEDIMRKFKKAVTDSEAVVRYDPAAKPGVSNLMQIYSVASGRDFAEIERAHSGRDGAPAGRPGVPGASIPWWCGKGRQSGRPDRCQGLQKSGLFGSLRWQYDIL